MAGVSEKGAATTWSARAKGQVDLVMITTALWTTPAYTCQAGTRCDWTLHVPVLTTQLSGLAAPIQCRRGSQAILVRSGDPCRQSRPLPW